MFWVITHCIDSNECCPQSLKERGLKRTIQRRRRQRQRRRWGRFKNKSTEDSLSRPPPLRRQRKEKRQNNMINEKYEEIGEDTKVGKIREGEMKEKKIKC